MTKTNAVRKEHAANCAGHLPDRVRLAEDGCHYHCYWVDGQIERRDTYVVYGDAPDWVAVLERGEKRVSGLWLSID